MTTFDRLSTAISAFAQLTTEEFQQSAPYWQICSYPKGSFYNEHRSICKHLGFVLEGVFRSYLIDAKTGEEKNVFLYSTNQFVVSFKSFLLQIPCDYHTQAMTNATVLCIHVRDLQALYQQSHAWERFGRLLAQAAFTVVMERTEGFLFKSPEQRYLDLIQHHPEIFNHIPLYHISSYLGIQGPSLSRIRKRISGK